MASVNMSLSQCNWQKRSKQFSRRLVWTFSLVVSGCNTYDYVWWSPGASQPQVKIAQVEQDLHDCVAQFSPHEAQETVSDARLKGWKLSKISTTTWP